MTRFWKSALSLLAVASLSACVTTSQRHPTATRSEDLKVATPAACRSAGGAWSRAAFGTPVCDIAFADAGKQCRDGSECLGECFWEDEARYPKDGAYGLCQPTAYYPACRSIVRHGGRLPMICEE